MLRFVIRRVVVLAVAAWLVASAAIVLGHWAQGDYVTQVLGFGASAETMRRAKSAYGLDQTLPEKYEHWLHGIARLDFGTSVKYQRPVGPLVLARTLNTGWLAVTACLIAAAIGLSSGMVTGSRPNTRAAMAIRMGSTLFLSCPPLLTSLLLVWAAAVTGLVPVGGMGSGAAATGWLQSVSDLVRYLPVPVLALALPVAATLERVSAQAIGEALAAPCITAARARGVSEARVRWHHATRLGAAPILAVGGALAGSLLSGSFAVELVTSWPGLGQLTYDAMTARDIDLAAACTVAAALLLGLAVLAADLVLAMVDPRTRPIATEAGRTEVVA